MSTPFLGQLMLASWNYANRGFALCNGQLLPINQNQALFSLFGTMYGGDGRTNFGLPNLQGRTPISFGNGFTQGAISGTESITLTAAKYPCTRIRCAGPRPRPAFPSHRPVICWPPHRERQHSTRAHPPCSR